MKVMLAKTVFWMGLLLVLLGEGGPRLVATGPGMPPGAPQGSLPVLPSESSPRLMASGTGIPPATGPQGAISVVS
jgi:hypothetical protein